MRRIHRGRRVWWTRERMITAGAQFFKQLGVTPTNESWWQETTLHCAYTPTGVSTKGSDRPYPSYHAVRRIWPGLRDFWKDVSLAYPELKIAPDAGDMPWSALEEWFIIESVGLIPREEVAELLGRTPPAIKRHLYELQVNSYNRWGWTLNHVQRVLNVSAATIKYYLNHGKLPFFQGHKCIYLDPADLFVIEEYNWAQKRHPTELEEAVRKSLMRRLCFALLRFDWHRFSYHKIQPLKSFYNGRVKKERERARPLEPFPTHVKVGQWAIITGESAKYFGASRRTGQIKAIVWSPQHRRATTKTPERKPCWIATIEFRKQRPPGKPELKRTRVNVPADSLQRVRKPYERKKELKPRRSRAARKKRLEATGRRALDNNLRIMLDPPVERISAR